MPVSDYYRVNSGFYCGCVQQSEDNNAPIDGHHPNDHTIKVYPTRAINRLFKISDIKGLFVRVYPACVEQRPFGKYIDWSYIPFDRILECEDIITISEDKFGKAQMICLTDTDEKPIKPTSDFNDGHWAPLNSLFQDKCYELSYRARAYIEKHFQGYLK